ncbi:isopeptide-forming domain-containing fimbrial protein [Amylolactobacillus amylophilus]|uniref:isopeptide-forming domain-containing fimbrial protein n=1 Tax=Amylolactobacillus amylophilus TaxID=1603 RepID=UPI0006D08F5C|nr:isopeptide-forming domain-containing fimbrial protein [Amylolactobacillus amylophilus]
MVKQKKLYNVFQFVDTFKTNQLTFIENTNSYSVKVSDGTTLTSDDYKVTVARDAVAGTTTVTTALTAAGIEKLATLANKEISFNYQMKINSLQYVDTDIVNTAQAIFGNDGTTGVGKWNTDTPTDFETVKTGGYKFVKVDVNNNNKKNLMVQSSLFVNLKQQMQNTSLQQQTMVFGQLINLKQLFIVLLKMVL